VRIEGAAQVTGLSTRNIRAYQSLGLVPPPQLEGRVGHYGAEHLARLQAIRRLQDQGFSLAGIRALFDAYERGTSLTELLGLPPPSLGEGSAGALPSGRLQLALVPGPLAPSVLEAPRN
jgi:DNA-binding transcriptional MerR regulator